MDNKGFTLIELVATIALLAIIAVISFVSINKFINDSKIANCETLVNNIEMAAKEYVADHRYDSSMDVFINAGYPVVRLELDDLIPNYLPEKVVDPYTNDNLLTSGFYVAVELNDDYTSKKIQFFHNDYGKITCGEKSFEYR